MTPTRPLTASQAAELLGVSVSTLRMWCRRPEMGVPHTVTAGGHRRFHERELRAWDAARRGETAQPDPDAVRAAAWREAAVRLLRAAAADLDGRPEAEGFWRLASEVEGLAERPGGHSTLV